MWEKTVMHLDDIDNGRMPDSYASQRKALEKQAEISFKAGYEQREKDPLDKEDRCERCYKQGIREVVEWIRITFNKDITIDQMMATTTWQYKEDEWGIKE